MLLHNHLDMIGRNEPIQRKAKFWQSYVRALKGTDDIRAPEATHYSRYPSSRGIFRPILDTFPSWPASKSIYDDPIAACDRMSVPGYRYLPISRETYGLSPRNIYPHNYSSLSRAPRSGRY
uniref:Ferredoxin-dependent glutamate synthase 2 n=1 Tax=Lygus hesperus TaxID=30085 RepID=A0A0A9X335_LYGHE